MSEDTYHADCPRCGGKGRLESEKNTVLFRFMGVAIVKERPRCWICNGRGYLVRQIGGWP